MCGIAGIILKQIEDTHLPEKIVSMSKIILHRGPDGEGFILATENNVTPYSNTVQTFSRTDLNYVPKKEIPKESPDTFLAFAHRRLSIIDLSDSGHQPMCNSNSKNWITYNGEIYNYLELREELKQLGHSFISESDTEVVLAAYQEWGFDCVKRFNGMWAFCIYDTEKKICFASRDRLGVKPFYYVNNKQVFSFASEQKAFIKSGLVPFKINRKALHEYLVNDLLESEPANFFEGVFELSPGTNLVYDLNTRSLKTYSYYHLKDHVNLKNDSLNENELIEKIKTTFENSVKLRLRSDVEVGTCLSGGIDSSALAVTMAEITKQPIHCFTSVFRSETFNEEHFADLVAKRIHAKHHKIEPTLESFEKEVDALIYSQDVPIWSTSTYAQYKVMELAKQNKIKVVLDGQGADELFGGYHHHFTAKWNNLFHRNNYFKAVRDIQSSNKTIPGSFVFYAKERLKHSYHFNKSQLPLFFTPEFLASSEVKNSYVYFNDVNEQLMSDIYQTRLKSFLKCEDRCGMWHSVESRTPFSDDIELINLLFSFNGNKKIQNGVSKYLLREAVKNKLPEEIYTRYDKKGFETPMEKWMFALQPAMLKEIKAAQFDFVNYASLKKCDITKPFHYKMLFKLYVLSKWVKAFN
ncbi:asparagine synthase (glutamine-hydrolyzing) [Aurantibacillus circumpalustris]|uniref:asparagine synthase (glutamine-hydrolyzing) n=1 Tax=Aurantibacillus circumpalustris TaxID=3036359 RepID=UPI00295B1E48|nr:asparagine synthase (glutamine-hydrolyzing) [Aurantibacillus circumpalustris]